MLKCCFKKTNSLDSLSTSECSDINCYNCGKKGHTKKYCYNSSSDEDSLLLNENEKKMNENKK
jgi:hypothetical protein